MQVDMRGAVTAVPRATVFRENKMKIKYLGTAAYEGVPSLFCDCEVCRKSKETGGRNLRSRSQALVNGDLLIDFPADTVWHSQRYGLNWGKITDCIITHSHSGHLYAADVAMLANGYAHGKSKLRFHCGKSGLIKLQEVAERERVGERLQLSLVKPFEKFVVCGGKYTVLPLPADHAYSTSPVIYAIESGGKRMLYAHDTGMFSEEVWGGLRDFGKFDFVSLDCTGCLALGGDWERGHMSVGSNLRTIERMKKEKIADDKTIFVINHFSHNGGQTHDELVEAVKDKGLIVAYDGLEIEF